MRGEKIYECDFDVTGATDYGITLDAILYQARKRFHRKERVSTSRLQDLLGVVSSDRCVVSIICAYAPMAA
jgi:hypothetical protein